MVYFTADLHLGHNAIINMQNRPFSSVDEMNNTLIENINAVAGRNDNLYILGDIAHHIEKEEREDLLKRIKAKKYLILGNHDLKGSDGTTNLDPSLFEWIKDYRKESLYEMNIVMMHYPLLSWHKMNSGSVMLHGHIHAGPEYNENNIRNGIRRYDVGVDANGYCPVPITRIKEWAEKTGFSKTHHAEDEV